MSDEGREVAPVFFTASPVICARALLGSEFRWDGCSGIVVETEAYAAEGDAACHTAFRPSAREFVRCHEAGTAYVYLNYGVHWLFNILVKGPEGCGFVLLRALEPRRGIGEMRNRRGRERSFELCSGPGKLTQALSIGGGAHGRPFLEGGDRGLVFGEAPEEVWEGPRIGISVETGLFWRFGVVDSQHVSAPFGRIEASKSGSQET